MTTVARHTVREPPTRKYVDHPAPSAILVFLLLFGTLFVLYSVFPLFHEIANSSTPIATGAMVGVIVLTTVVLLFYFWPLYKTYYTISATGLEVQYGPWKRHYAWLEFSAAYWRRGLFATRIGWPSITPCVRLTNAVHLKRQGKWFGLYLTPNDPKAFLLRIGEFVPELTAETIV